MSVEKLYCKGGWWQRTPISTCNERAGYWFCFWTEKLNCCLSYQTKFSSEHKLNQAIYLHSWLRDYVKGVLCLFACDHNREILSKHPFLVEYHSFSSYRAIPNLLPFTMLPRTRGIPQLKFALSVQMILQVTFTPRYTHSRGREPPQTINETREHCGASFSGTNLLMNMIWIVQT